MSTPGRNCPLMMGFSREAWSMTAGMVVAAAGLAAWAGPLWPFVFAGSMFVILFVGLFAIAPAYLFLKRRGQLRIWWAVLVGVAAVNLPNLLYALPTALFSGGSYVALNGEVLVDFHGITAAGLYHYFVKPALFLSPFGALGAVIAWLLAFGFRLQPPYDTKESDDR